MMNKDQEETVKLVYRSFLSHDYNRQWTPLDDYLHSLDYLNDEQTVLEVETQLYRHGKGTLKCAEDHGDSQCLVPQMMDSVNAICELYQETRSLHPKNRYILQNYLAASHNGIIYVEENPS